MIAEAQLFLRKNSAKFIPLENEKPPAAALDIASCFL